jgi:hypothetical protein
VSEPHAIHLGAAWQPPDAAGTEGRHWLRRFGLPAGLGPADRVWLAIERPAACRLAVNGSPLPPCAAGIAYRVDVTPLLRERNELVLEAASASAAPVDAGCSVDRHGRVPLPAAFGRMLLEIVTGD